MTLLFPFGIGNGRVSWDICVGNEMVTSEIRE